ncbi:unnamed protein product [Boreogadus saida]
MSGGNNQKTLFQAWGGSVPQKNPIPTKHNARKTVKRPLQRNKTDTHTVETAKTQQQQRVNGQALPPRRSLWGEIGQVSGPVHTAARMEDVQELDDDELLLVAVYEAEQTLQTDATAAQDDKKHATEEIEPSPLCSSGRYNQDYPGFDSSSATVWIYPTNLPIREYQLKISEAALFQNTLVCLPTGLGKTFIAAVVMYNFYRWYPSGKIVFMAPTKPLVAQQIEACYKVMGIPQKHMAELTGSTKAGQRRELWKSRRVFFLTPQVMVNDLSRETCPALQVKCVVIDEAHKALGNQAYCQVVRQLCSQTQQFRILALSATPGGDSKAVQQVISNLLISHIELRSEASPDIKAHTHQRTLEKVVVPLGEALAAQQARYLQVMEKFTSRLTQNQVMSHKNLRSLTKYQIILAREQFRKNPPPHIKGPQQGAMEGDFALTISLCHGYELLMQMGLRSLFFFVQGIMDGSKAMARARNELQRTPVFMDLYKEMEAMFMKSPADPDQPFIYSHPKLKKLEEVVLQHFRLWAENSANKTETTSGSAEGGVSTRVMIFSSFRESVQEIASMLNQHAPLIRVMTFMGQASAGKGVKGFTQKEQLETYNQSQINKNSVDKSIVGNQNSFHMYPNNPRMLPEGVTPTLHKMHITSGQFDHGDSSGGGGRRDSGGRRARSEGQTPLIHPQNLAVCQSSVRSDGFLSPAEYSLWASTMRLREDEAQPTLRTSHFLSLPCTHTPTTPRVTDSPGRGPGAREMSLWEWRHWQNRALPTHLVDHSARCLHFIQVMELIDRLREESPEGGCSYEKELLPHLHKGDVIGLLQDGQAEKPSKRPTKINPKACSTKSKSKSSSRSASELEGIGEEEEEEDRDHGRGIRSFSPSTTVRGKPLMEDDPDFMGFRDEEQSNHDPGRIPETWHDCIVEPEDDNISENNNLSSRWDLVGEPPPSIGDHDSDPGLEENIEFQATFYLPRGVPVVSSSLKSLPEEQKSERLRVILANVAELLSRSPPPLPLDFVIEEDMLEIGSPDPPIPTSLPPSPEQVLSEQEEQHQPLIQVNFDLDLDDDDDDDDDVIDCGDVMMKNDDPCADDVCDVPGTSKPILNPLEPEIESVADSPSWDEVFGYELDHNGPRDEVFVDDELGNQEFNQRVDDRGKAAKCTGRRTEEEAVGRRDGDVNAGRMPAGPLLVEQRAPCRVAGPSYATVLDESMDLFGDDEAFLRMTIPELSTPEESFAADALPHPKHLADGVQHTEPNISHFAVVSACDAIDLTESVRRQRANCSEMSSFSGTKPMATPATHSPPPTHRVVKTPRHGHDKTPPTASETSPDSRNAAPSGHGADDASTTEQPNVDSLDGSCELFPVNFDLGYSLDDSEEEAVQEEDEGVVIVSVMKASPHWKEQELGEVGSAVPLPPIPGSSTPLHGHRRRPIGPGSCGRGLPTPISHSAPHREGEISHILATPLSSQGGPLASPSAWGTLRRTLLPGPSLCPPGGLKRKQQQEEGEGPSSEAKRPNTSRAGAFGMEDSRGAKPLPSRPADPGLSDSEEEVQINRRRPQARANPLSSPNESKMFSHVDSPVMVKRKKAAVLNISEEAPEGGAMSDDDFQNDSTFSHKPRPSRPTGPIQQQGKTQKSKRPRGGRLFLDEEAALSDEEGEGVSSDEEDGYHLNRSLEGFVVDNSNLSQGLNESEMHGMYLKSLRSPVAAGHRFKMVYKPSHNMDIFSQVPEMDETYAEDSFVVGSQEEEEVVEEEEGGAEDEVVALPEVSYVDGRKQYTTRRQVLLHHMRSKAGSSGRPGAGHRGVPPKPDETGKRSRIVKIQDSSEEEEEEEEEKEGEEVAVLNSNAATLFKPSAVLNDATLDKPPQRQNASSFSYSSSSSSSSIASKISSLSRKTPHPSSTDLFRESRCRQRLENQARLSEELDFEESESMLAPRKPPKTTTSTLSSNPQPYKPFGHALSTDKPSMLPPATTAPTTPTTAPTTTTTITTPTNSSTTTAATVCILVDSRCISSSADLVSGLRQHHSVNVHVCSLDSNYFVLSNRMAAERHTLSELAAVQNRKRLVKRVNDLQGLFERACFIVEKDPTKPGEVGRSFQRTLFFEGTLASLVQAGVRLLWSDGVRDSARLLADLAQLEQRKGQAISVPLEVRGQHRQQALQFYLALPGVGYVHALHMVHNFVSVAQFITSSVEAIQKGGGMSRSRAEDTYRCIRYSCDSFLLNTSSAKKKR